MSRNGFQERSVRQHHERKRIARRQGTTHPGSDGPEFNVPTCPSAFAKGCEEARCFHSAVAGNYLRHTTVGDPELDPVTRELVALHSLEMHRFVRAGLERDDEAMLRRTPQALRDFFDSVRAPESVDFGRSSRGSVPSTAT